MWSSTKEAGNSIGKSFVKFYISSLVLTVFWTKKSSTLFCSHIAKKTLLFLVVNFLQIYWTSKLQIYWTSKFNILKSLKFLPLLTLSALIFTSKSSLLYPSQTLNLSYLLTGPQVWLKYLISTCHLMSHVSIWSDILNKFHYLAEWKS